MVKLKKLNEAEASYRQAIALKPDLVGAHHNLRNVLHDLDKQDQAKESYKQVLAIEPDHASARHMLAAISGETTSTAPRDYVEALFDGYAPKFESALVDNLEYKIPSLITKILNQENESDSLGAVLDLGCGTGLFGEAIQSRFKRLEGVDLSGKNDRNS